MLDLKEVKYLGDVSARTSVEIDVRQDGLVVWINVDAICIARILTNGVTVPITVTDNRKDK